MRWREKSATHKLLFSAYKYKQLIAPNDELKYNDEVSEIKFIIRFLLSISLCLVKSICIRIGILQLLKLHIYISGFVCVCVCFCIGQMYHMLISSIQIKWIFVQVARAQLSDREMKPFEQSMAKRVLEDDKEEEKEKNTKNKIKRNWNKWYTQIMSIENDQLRESLIKFFFPFFSLNSKIFYHSHINVQ